MRHALVLDEVRISSTERPVHRLTAELHARRCGRICIGVRRSASLDDVLLALVTAEMIFMISKTASEPLRFLIIFSYAPLSKSVMTDVVVENTKAAYLSHTNTIISCGCIQRSKTNVPFQEAP